MKMNNEKQNKQTVDEMIRYIAEEDNLKHFLEKYKIAKISEINYKKYYHKDDNREVVIIDTKEEYLSNKTKIMIDLRLGQPIVNQVYDALYDVGKDCDIKIIVYSNGYNDYDKGIPVADEYLASSLIAQLQNKNVPIVLFAIDYSNFKLKYVDMYQNWYQVNRLRSSKIPTKEKFMTETFWGIYFDSFNATFYEPWSAYSDCFNNTIENHYIIYIDSIFFGEIKLFWDEKGVRYEIKQVSESDEYLKKVLDVDMSALKERYGESSVKFENVVGRLPRLYIKYSDKPFSWLYKATPRQITEFAEKMYHDAWGLRWMIEESIEKLYEMEPA